MNIFDLAIAQAQRKKNLSLSSIIDNAIKIRAYLDKLDAKKSKRLQ